MEIRKQLNPISMVCNLYRHRELIIKLIKREIISMYQGSFLGILWTLILPLIMLLIYTYVFSVVFQAKWSTQGIVQQSSQGEFALILYAGLTPFSIFSTVLTRAPGMVLSVPNYVKKVIFPLEILPIVVAGGAIFTSLISVILILIASLFVFHSISTTIWLLPLAYIPLILLTLGLAWFVASLGVYIRDISQIVNIVVRVLFFLSPIFYSVDLVPENLKLAYSLNPLSSIIDGFRRVLIFNQTIDWSIWAIVTAVSIFIAIFGYAWFMITKKGFADVI